MGKIITIGLDIAKHVFQVHGVDAAGAVVSAGSCGATMSRRSLKPAALPGGDRGLRDRPSLGAVMSVGARGQADAAGHVKPYVKRQKNDATDAEAICEAVTRPTMRFVPVKGEEQQSVLMLHRTRELLIRQRTM